MSVAGILASSIFSGLGSQAAQKSTSAGSSIESTFDSDLQSGNVSGAQSIFSALQQKMLAQSSGSTTATRSALSSQLAQLGQDLKSSNLTAAQSDFATIRSNVSNDLRSRLHHQSGASSQDGSSATNASSLSSQAGSGSQSSMTAALQAYSAMQLNPLNASLNSSMIGNPSTFAVNA